MKQVLKNVSKYDFLRPPEQSPLTQQALYANQIALIDKTHPHFTLDYHLGNPHLCRKNKACS